MPAAARIKGIVLTRATLMDRVWGFEAERENRTLDVHIRTLRVKLGEAGSHHRDRARRRLQASEAKAHDRKDLPQLHSSIGSTVLLACILLFFCVMYSNYQAQAFDNAGGRRRQHISAGHADLRR